MKKILFILVLLCTVFQIEAQKKQPQQPNVVIIFMDDMGYGDPGFNMGIVRLKHL